MNPKYFFKRFRSVRDAHLGNVSSWKKPLYYADYFMSFIFNGASINDYFAYKFFQLRHNGRNEYITFRKYHRILNTCNPDKDAIDICRDKIKFNTYFSKYLGRKWLDVNNSSYEDFKKFLENIGDVVFVKAIDGYRGIGVKCYNVKDLDFKMLYDELRNNMESRFILEEKINQTGALSEFHKWSINTIRIVTVYDKKHDKVNIMSANIRFGRSHDSRDNLHSGGIAVQIDIKSGIVNSVGFDSNNYHYLSHPDSNKQFIGFKVPYWDECKNFIEEIARQLPTVGYVGWDIVSKGDGSFVLIEGNDNADHDIQQLNNKGMWQEYKEVLKQMK